MKIGDGWKKLVVLSSLFKGLGYAIIMSYTRISDFALITSCKDKNINKIIHFRYVQD